MPERFWDLAEPAPWHRAPACAAPTCGSTVAVPLAVAGNFDRRGMAADEVRATHLFCPACGHHWEEADPWAVVRAWWGAGAWEGSEAVRDTTLAAYVYRHRDWSARTFGEPKERDGRAGVLDHLRRELAEVEAAIGSPGELEEWVDVATLAIDGAWRSGASPSDVARALEAKQRKNMAREWPDWRQVPEGQAIEHVEPGGKA